MLFSSILYLLLLVNYLFINIHLLFFHNNELGQLCVYKIYCFYNVTFISNLITLIGNVVSSIYIINKYLLVYTLLINILM